MQLGLASMKLGAGRETLDDIIDSCAGIVLNKKLGDKVGKGDILLTMYTEKPGMESMVSSILNNFDFSDTPVEVGKTVEERISMADDGSFIIEKD